MGEIRREMERLRPVYETGVLRLLLRPNSMIYVALLRSAFDPLTGELPREILEDRFVQGLDALIESGDVTLRDDETTTDAASRILAELTREGDGDYAWLANSLDVASHRFLYRLTARAHRAIEALDRLEDDTRTLSGAQANSIIMEIEHARMKLTADPAERIDLLTREIEDRQRQIERIRSGETHPQLDGQQVEDIIAVVHNTLRGVPIDLRELALTERDNGDMLRRRMQSGTMTVDEILTAYHDEYRRSFRESDSGRRFEDAFQVIVTDEGRRQIDDAMRAIAKTPYLAGESRTLLNQVKAELARIYDGIEDVRRQMRVSDEAVSRLVRQQTDTRYRTMLARLNRLFVTLNTEARNTPDDPATPYHTDVGSVRLAGLPTRPARAMTRSATPGLTEQDAPVGKAPDLAAMIEIGGPRLKHMTALIGRDPYAVRTDDGAVDVAASFNRLPERERRESEIIGFLGALHASRADAERADTDCGDAGRAAADTVIWHCVSIDGTPRLWRTRPILATPETLAAIEQEG
ncbi:DUF3375 domain-containing protein [Bifidobacterium simiarum]|uniref:DUF3375 domain-containing protein n=1 Tax=Bifidobacterium simiarum TaxID=2045441 RepID=UPI001BDBD49D|nr:DUF3375 domain-containing protein [Bifidobacterium simiarum]MBT1166869.1 DUF3375 domain-containing protein [Bifidobacterium simiarum]